MFRTARAFASPGTDFPGYSHAPSLPREGGGGFEEERTGTRLRGGETPSPVPYPMAIATTVHSMGRSRRRTGYGSSPGIPTHCPRSSRWGRGRSAKRGRGGGTERSALWGMGRRPDMARSFGITALTLALPRSSRSSVDGFATPLRGSSREARSLCTPVNSRVAAEICEGKSIV